MVSFYAKVMKDPNDYLRPHQVKAFFNAIEDVRDMALYQTLLKSGRRIGEVVRRLKPEHINYDKNWINWFIEKKKVETWRVKIEHPTLIYLLKKYIELYNINDGMFLFPISRQRSTQLIQKYGAKIHLPKARQHNHVFRHTFASMFLEAGGRIDVLKDRLEHSSILVTMSYPHYSPTQEKGILNDMFD